MAVIVGMLCVIPMCVAWSFRAPHWGPLGPTYQVFVSNESIHPEGEYETVIVGYTIPGTLAEVRDRLRRDFGSAMDWKTVSHAIQRESKFILWIRELEGFKAPGLDPAGPIHVDLSIKRKAGVATKIKHFLFG